MMATACSAQDASIKEQRTNQGHRADFDKALAEWRKVSQQYIRFILSWHMDAPSATDRQKRQEWADLQMQSRAAFDKSFQEAMKIVATGLKTDPEVTFYLLQSAMYRSNQEWSEGTGEAIDLLVRSGEEFDQLVKEAGVSPGPLFRAAGRGFFFTGKMDEAEHYLRLAAETKSLKEDEEVLPRIVPMFRTIWEEELRCREADAANDLPRVRFHTSRGPFVVELFEDEMPNTVANFISLIESGFFDRNVFYHVLKGKMAFAGDPHGDGGGNAGYFIPEELHPRRKVVRGTLTMAKQPVPSGEQGKVLPHSASSQFVICLSVVGTESLMNSPFGRIVEGIETVSALTEVELNPKEKKKKQQSPPDSIFSAEVLRKRDHPYVPIKLKSPYDVP
jgi:peptidylprolyl isomerase